MARGRTNPESWRIVMNKETKKVIAYNQSTAPEMKTAAERKKYEEIGKFNKQEDAETFCQYKELGLLPDAVAYMDLERKIHAQTEEAETLDEQKLEKMIDDVKATSGRECFGNCQSLNTAPACATCFASLRRTWTLCASIKSIRSATQKAP